MTYPVILTPEDRIALKIGRDVMAEWRRAYAKHGDNSTATKGSLDPRWLADLTEEIGEVAHELTYDAEEGDLAKELLQVSAVAMGWRHAVHGWARLP